ncbi:hypothetical protein JW968_06135 [Candidatus Woesearchaeota archaeon]|nr:hypothetical protein [Candidatus Woesearchaeota archaeon]
MESYQVLRDEAKKRLSTADHMLTQTYPMVNDPKILIAVLQNLHSSLDKALCSILEHERHFKRIPPYHNSFTSRLNLLRTKFAVQYGLEDLVKLMDNVDSKLAQHKDSPIEFARKGQFVICDKRYNVQTLSVPELKQSIKIAKSVMNRIEDLTSKNERILERLKAGNKPG